MAEARQGVLIRLAAAARSHVGSFGFAHGVHPPEHKELTAHLPIRRMAALPVLYLLYVLVRPRQQCAGNCGMCQHACHVAPPPEDPEDVHHV